ncbi:Uncharacterised protein [Kingella potus]|uniref:Uncharacterized protein n=1 Tax=Kingella potus TaxID=265175 RepID=A0A377QYF8_9NEIS|nr:hypothetical protein [Kingella potus]STR00273.1 Uncharacterised protein [Kingella potus]
MSQTKKKRQAAAPAFPPPLFALHAYAADDTLRRISSADYGMEAGQHYVALQTVLRGQNGYLSVQCNGVWHPAEAVELAACNPADAAAYTLCRLILIQSAIAGTYGELTEYGRQQYQSDRAQLPPSCRAALDAAYRLAAERGLFDE